MLAYISVSVFDDRRIFCLNISHCDGVVIPESGHQIAHLVQSILSEGNVTTWQNVARGKDLLPAQKLARGLRQRGFSVARDIIDRSLEESLNYARKTDFRALLEVGSEQDDVRIIRLNDGQERNVSYRELLSESFKL